MIASPTLLNNLKDLSKDMLPEQKRAMEALGNLLPAWQNYLQDSCQLQDLCKHGNKFFTTASLATADLPKGSNWQWNQSRSKKKLHVQSLLDLSFCKLNTRKARGCTERSPSYKVWVFQMNFLEDGFVLYFAWCEKGTTNSFIEEQSQEHSPLAYSAPAQVTVQPQTQAAPLFSNCYFPAEYYAPTTFFPEPIEQISLNELSFLREFTDVFTAHQLGWVQ